MVEVGRTSGTDTPSSELRSEDWVAGTTFSELDSVHLVSSAAPTCAHFSDTELSMSGLELGKLPVLKVNSASSFSDPDDDDVIDEQPFTAADLLEDSVLFSKEVFLLPGANITMFSSSCNIHTHNSNKYY